VAKALRAIGSILATVVGFVLGGPLGAVIASTAFNVIVDLAFPPKPPTARGSVSQVLIAVDPPRVEVDQTVGSRLRCASAGWYP
jgi:hypothetical protein